MASIIKPVMSVITTSEVGLYSTFTNIVSQSAVQPVTKKKITQATRAVYL